MARAAWALVAALGDGDARVREHAAASFDGFCGDASAALGIIARKGVGKLRHIDVGHLWIQSVAAERRVRIHKVPGTMNPGDMLKKPFAAAKSEEYSRMMGLWKSSGRAEVAPQLH